jgi:5-formyltetrahydrofolate cyclo-ligase
MTDQAETKRGLRLAAKALRSDAARSADGSVGALAAEQFLAHISIRVGQVVSAYWPFGDEFDTRPLMHRLVGFGANVALPVVVRKLAPLIFRRWRPGDALEPAVLGTSMPSGDRPELVPEVLIVPLLAFDAEGYRLGYGGGYYDLTLAGLRAMGRPMVAVGLAYAAQEQALLPRETFDQRLDWVVTEREARRFQ